MRIPERFRMELDMGEVLKQVFEYFGYTLPGVWIMVANILQWVFAGLLSVSGFLYGWYQRRAKIRLEEENQKLELAGHNLDWMVIGAGAVTLNNTHMIETFTEETVVSRFGVVFADTLKRAAEATIKRDGTQILVLDESVLSKIRPKATNALNWFSNPLTVGFLAQKSGQTEFVVCFSCSDYAESRKIRLSIRSVAELEAYRDGKVRLNQVIFDPSYHSYDGALTAEMSREWFANPTKKNRLCWPIRLRGQLQN